MASILKSDGKPKIWLRQSMRINLQNNPAKFHRDTIWNDSLRFFEDGLVRPNKKNKKKNKMSSDKWSVPDPKRFFKH